MWGSQTLRTDARIIAATNRDLALDVEQGRFRSDLFYRLNVFPIEVPPLRERREDIPVLVEYFASRHGARLGKKFRRVDRRTMDRLLDYPWPGNIRELENWIERAAILSEGDKLSLEEPFAHPDGESSGFDGAGERLSLRDQEKRSIERALAACHGRVSGKGSRRRDWGFRDDPKSKIRRLKIDKYRFR